jgi:hypothetical protein
VDPKEEMFMSYFVKQYKLSMRIHLLELILITIFSLATGFAVDFLIYFRDDKYITSWDLVGQGGTVNDLCKSVAGIIFGFCVFGWIVRQLIIRTYRKKHTSTTFWFDFIKTKKKVALFFLTVSYQPVAKNLLVNFADRFYVMKDGNWSLNRRDYAYPLCMP